MKRRLRDAHGPRSDELQLGKRLEAYAHATLVIGFVDRDPVPHVGRLELYEDGFVVADGGCEAEGLSRGGARATVAPSIESRRLRAADMSSRSSSAWALVVASIRPRSSRATARKLALSIRRHWHGQSKNPGQNSRVCWL